MQCVPCLRWMVLSRLLSMMDQLHFTLLWEVSHCCAKGMGLLNINCNDLFLFFLCFAHSFPCTCIELKSGVIFSGYANGSIRVISTANSALKVVSTAAAHTRPISALSSFAGSQEVFLFFFLFFFFWISINFFLSH